MVVVATWADAHLTLQMRLIVTSLYTPHTVIPDFLTYPTYSSFTTYNQQSSLAYIWMPKGMSFSARTHNRSRIPYYRSETKYFIKSRLQVSYSQKYLYESCYGNLGLCTTRQTSRKSLVLLLSTYPK